MGKARRKFDEQYKREAVRFLEETGRPLREVAEELQVSEQSLWRWREKYGAGATERASPSEAAELRRVGGGGGGLRPGGGGLQKKNPGISEPLPPWAAPRR